MAQGKDNFKKKGLLSKREETELSDKLIHETHFTKQEMESLIKIYKKFLTGTIMEKSTFLGVLHNALGMTDEYFMDRVFHTVDDDRDGFIGIQEFVKSMSVMLRGTMHEKIQFCFTVFDIKQDMQLSREEICTLLKQALVQTPDEDPDEGILDLVEIVMKKMDHDKDGHLTFEEYKTSVEEDPLLLEAFGPCLPSDTSRAAFLALFSESHPILNDYE